MMSLSYVIGMALAWWVASGRERIGVVGFIIVAVIAAAILFPIAIWSYRRTMRLARYGVEVVAELTPTGKLGMYGRAPVKCRFELDCKVWEVEAGVYRPLIGPDMRVTMLVDPANPKVVAPKDELLGFR